jgi:hypothetical protein
MSDKKVVWLPVQAVKFRHPRAVDRRYVVNHRKDKWRETGGD